MSVGAWPVEDVKSRKYDPRVDPFQYEKDFQSWLRNAALRLGWLYYHTADSRKNDTGFPDTTLVHPRKSRLIFAELKTPWRPNPTDAQREWLNSLVNATRWWNEEHTVEVYLWRLGKGEGYTTLDEITEVLK